MHCDREVRSLAPSTSSHVITHEWPKPEPRRRLEHYSAMLDVPHTSAARRVKTACNLRPPNEHSDIGPIHTAAFAASVYLCVCGVHGVHGVPRNAKSARRRRTL